MPTIERLEVSIAENAKLAAKWAKRLSDAEDTICRAVPMLKRLGKQAERWEKALLVLKREARRKPKVAPPEPGLNDPIGL